MAWLPPPAGPGNGRPAGNAGAPPAPLSPIRRPPHPDHHVKHPSPLPSRCCHCLLTDAAAPTRRVAPLAASCPGSPAAVPPGSSLGACSPSPPAPTRPPALRRKPFAPAPRGPRGNPGPRRRPLRSCAARGARRAPPQAGPSGCCLAGPAPAGLGTAAQAQPGACRLGRSQGPPRREPACTRVACTAFNAARAAGPPPRRRLAAACSAAALP